MTQCSNYSVLDFGHIWVELQIILVWKFLVCLIMILGWFPTQNIFKFQLRNISGFQQTQYFLRLEINTQLEDLENQAQNNWGTFWTILSLSTFCFDFKTARKFELFKLDQTVDFIFKTIIPSQINWALTVVLVVIKFLCLKITWKGHQNFYKF